MRFITNILGVPQDIVQAIDEKKAALASLKTANRTIEELREKLEDTRHDRNRANYLDVREVQEAHADDVRSYERELELAGERQQYAVNDAIERTRRENKAELAKRDETIAGLQSDNRELRRKLEEKQANTDLAIQEGILEYQQEHIGEMADLEVSLAKSQGETKTAQAESKSKDAVIAVLTKMVEARGGDVTEALELVAEVTPNVDLSNLSFNVTAPAAQKQGGDNKQK